MPQKLPYKVHNIMTICKEKVSELWNKPMTIMPSSQSIIIKEQFTDQKQNCLI